MDPYKVLGVSPDAPDDEVRQAYRQLAKKYHPDNYVNNPIADLAAEKMKEINTAYDMIVNRRAEPGGQDGPGQSGAYSGSAGQNPAYSAIRSYISYGNLEAAEELLIKISDRNAEWYFLMGSVYFRRGWMDQAADFFGKAAQMEPQNPEYAAARNRMDMQRNIYQSRGGYSSGGCSSCDVCSSLLCADCCCECMGGDLISCC